MTLLAVLAQVSNDVANAVSPLYSYGPLGIVTSFFMLVLYRVMISRDAEMLARDAKLVTAMEKLSHDMEGIRRAMLVDLMERQNVTRYSKQFAERELAKIQATTEMKHQG